MFVEDEKYAEDVAQLLQELYRRTGADYRNYSPTFLGRRFAAILRKNGFSCVSEMEEVLFQSDHYMHELLDALSLPTTRMFRDAHVFQSLRKKVIPELSQSRLEKVWSAGCSTGEEAYTLSIIFKEELPDRKVITFATDHNERSLHTARKGIYPLRRMRLYTSAYLDAGGIYDFSRYYFADSENAVMLDDLKRNLVFALHNLVTDATFNEFDLILCRNVLIYFNRQLQLQVLNLLFQSMRAGGILILGDKESLKSMMPERSYEEVDRFSRIFRKL